MKRIFVFVLLVVFLFAAVTPAFALDGNPPPPLFDMTAISAALQNLLILVLTAVAGFAVRWLNSKYKEEKAKLNAWQEQALETFINVCVFAAEQLHVTEQIDNKLDYVIEMVEVWLSNRGLTMDVDEIRARIEAAVRQELNRDKPTPTPDPAPAG